MWDETLTTIVDELKNTYHCHTIILYGSRARGDHTSTSDYDVAGIRKTGQKKRIARFDENHNVYHDIFIYPESVLKRPTEEHLIMSDGLVILEQDHFGQNLLKKLNKLFKKTENISKDELELRKVWYQKMLARASTRDVEGKYRHIWIIFVILEDYFAFRGMRYQGPKKAFQYLQKHDSNTWSLFENALSDTNNIEILSKLIINVSCRD